MSSPTRDQLQSQLEQALTSHTAVVASSVDVSNRTLGRLEQFMKTTEERLSRNELRMLAEDDQEALARRRMRSKQRGERSIRLKPRQDAVGVQLRRYNTACTAECPCVCHKPDWGGTPTMLRRILGQLFVDYAGLPIMRPQCDNKRCQKRTGAYLDFEYWFPTGVFWSQIIRIHCAYQAHLGPQFQLSTLRRVPDNAPAVLFASSGNIEGLKDLFQRGLASPRDVSETRGYSLLRVSPLVSVKLP